MQDDVPADLSVVHHGAVVANLDVVTEMTADHEHIAVADPGDAPAVDGSAVNRHVFANNVAIADPQRRRLAPIGPVLRALAEYGPVADEVLGAHDSGPDKQAWASMTHSGPTSTGPSMIAYGPT